MKILITTDTYRPTINGVVTSIESLKKALDRLGHDVRILTFSDSFNSKQEGDIYYMGSLGAGKFYPDARMNKLFYNRFYEDIMDWKPDIVHSQTEFTMFIQAKKIAKDLDIPLLHTYHTVYEDYTHYFSLNKKIGKELAKQFTKQIIKNTDGVVVPTNKIYNLLTEYNIHEDIYVAPTGINVNKLSECDDFDIRSGYKIPEDKHIVLFLGRIGKEKNITEILQYLENINRDDIVFIIAGAGPFLSELKDICSNSKIRDRLIFTGMIDSSKVGNFYSKADVFVSASTSETQGLTFIESMACSTPIICRHDDCLDGVLIEGKTGFGYDTEEEFIDYLNQILDNEKLRDKMGKNCKQLVDENYTEDSFANKIEKIYKKVIENHAKSVQ
ncbi:glycosyltransferase family 4 protein [Finegoldia magna]|uniref:Glycosyl transferase n=1 Tax=Finegoldia magna TaxID=1260 RepID=A0A233VHV1_FINMA|nr:glycosyltransferase family 4 protein [Finegoldia magna]MBS5964068.1 glycosyltransferase family 4 protein [Finegoldia magna]MDU1400002.1 glycosyltransferase family 4 protein [Finegoldia magna]MDU4018451.1 glycosyltransferase family 4 protein [Finegoldia magna]MDU5224033.1 glycosyltransferase family 4 protein [Finegoldia magna]MDU5368509.1 glycosyltransferase family 4 protein [Finegoldia magna]